MSNVAVIGTGSWGTAAAGLLAVNSDEVLLFARDPQVAEAINTTHRNPRHLSDYTLPEHVISSTDPSRLRDVEALVVVVPSSFLRETMQKLAPYVNAGTPVCVLTKGIEHGTGKLMTEVISEELGGRCPVAALSGPNHAEEICRGKISAAVVASEDADTCKLFQKLFVSPTFRAYATSDLKGVELCAAIKNVIAIAAGIAVGLGAGDNTLAVLMTRGLAEIGRINAAAGGDPLTCMGLAGMGDLIVTCSSRHSRNRSFGEAFVAGESLEAYEARTHMVVEGARAAISTREMARKLKVDCPITENVYAILYEHGDLTRAVDNLLDRTPREEFYGIDEI